MVWFVSAKQLKGDDGQVTRLSKPEGLENGLILIEF